MRSDRAPDGSEKTTVRKIADPELVINYERFVAGLTKRDPALRVDWNSVYFTAYKRDSAGRVTTFVVMRKIFG